LTQEAETRPASRVALVFILVSLAIALAGPAPASASGEFLTKWGSFGAGDGQFNEPFGVATDNRGDVYVGDTLNHRIQKFKG
jgi:hypothetical protein